MLRTIAIIFIYWHQRCIGGTDQRKIVAYQEPTVSRPFLLFQRVVAVDKLLAGRSSTLTGAASSRTSAAAAPTQTIALANKLARIAWSVLARGRGFEANKFQAA